MPCPVDGCGWSLWSACWMMGRCSRWGVGGVNVVELVGCRCS